MGIFTSSKWLGGHKSNAESKHTCCSFISIPYKLNLPRETDAKPQFAKKIYSLDVPNDCVEHRGQTLRMHEILKRLIE